MILTPGANRTLPSPFIPFVSGGVAYPAHGDAAGSGNLLHHAGVAPGWPGKGKITILWLIIGIIIIIIIIIGIIIIIMNGIIVIIINGIIIQ